MAGQIDDALTDYETAIGIATKRADTDSQALAYAHRARLLEAKGERDRASADYAAALKLDAVVADEFTLYARIFERAGRLDRALIEYETALKLDPKLWWALRGRDRVRAALAAAGERK
jgi:tetratricopeptide (TPR) repeat protein